MFKPDSGEPFGLPRGTVRGVIALTMLGLLGYDFVLDQAFTVEMVAIAGPYLGFYFGTRGSEQPKPEAQVLDEPSIGTPSLN